MNYEIFNWAGGLFHNSNHPSKVTSDSYLPSLSMSPVISMSYQISPNISNFTFTGDAEANMLLLLILGLICADLNMCNRLC